MSIVKVQGNASGTGIFTIAAPNSNTDRTLTLPDVTATLITDSSGVLNIGSGQVYKDSSGNVGIGTSSPGARLVVSGTTASDIYRLASNQSAPTSTDAFIYRPTDNTLGFGTASTERARIDSSGNLLVGTTTTDIWTGSATNTGFKIESNGTTTIARSGFAALLLKRTTASTGNVAEFAYGTSQVGSISVTGSATAYNTSSDYRLKEDVQPMQGALARVSALKPVTYKWKSTGEPSEGFIAHELQAVCPDAVTGEKDAVNEDGSIKPQGIDTSFLVATLTAAIQELKAEVDALKAQLAGAQA